MRVLAEEFTCRMPQTTGKRKRHGQRTMAIYLKWHSVICPQSIAATAQCEGDRRFSGFRDAAESRYPCLGRNRAGMQNFPAANLKRDWQNLSPVRVQNGFFCHFFSECRCNLIVPFREAKAREARQMHPVLLIDDLRVGSNLSTGVPPDLSLRAWNWMGHEFRFERAVNPQFQHCAGTELATTGRQEVTCLAGWPLFSGFTGISARSGSRWRSCSRR